MINKKISEKDRKYATIEEDVFFDLQIKSVGKTENMQPEKKIFLFDLQRKSVKKTENMQPEKKIFFLIYKENQWERQKVWNWRRR